MEGSLGPGRRSRPRKAARSSSSPRLKPANPAGPLAPLPPGTPQETMVFAVTKVRLDGCLFGPPSERDYRTVFRDRTVNGLDDLTGFHIATICHPVYTDTGTDWLVKAR